MSGREARPRPPRAGVLVYDGDCDLCARWSRRLLRVAGLPDDARVAHSALPDGARAAVEAAGLRNELKWVASGPTGAGVAGAVVGGVEAIRATCRGTRLAPFLWPTGLPPVRAAADGLYRLIAYNRRVLSPRPSGLACPCDPDPHRGYNVAFLLLVGAVTALGWWAVLWSGDAALRGGPLAGLAGAGDAAWKVPLLLGPVVGAVGVPRGNRLAWTSHLLLAFARAGVAFVAAAAGIVLARAWGAGRGVEVAVLGLGAVLAALRFTVSLRRALPTMRVLAVPPPRDLT